MSLISTCTFDLKLVLFFGLVCMMYHFSDVRSFFTICKSMLISLKLLGKFQNICDVYNPNERNENIIRNMHITSYHFMCWRQCLLYGRDMGYNAQSFLCMLHLHLAIKLLILLYGILIENNLFMQSWGRICSE